MVGSGGVGLPSFSESDLMAALLAEDTERSASEPDIAAGIVEQMLHMEMQPLPRSIRVRIRDVIARVEPASVVEVGAGIGHLSAWLYDLWNVESGPKKYLMVEEGSRFAVVLKRLTDRHGSPEWAKIVVSPWLTLAAQSLAAAASSASSEGQVLPDSHDSSAVTIALPVDAIIIHPSESGTVANIEAALSLLSVGGILLTPEPLVPTADVGLAEPGAPLTKGQQQVEEFNAWISLVKGSEATHSIGFVECTGGTLVAFRRR
jgi:hypothetical protein